MGFSESIARLGLDATYAEPALLRESGGDLQLYTLLKGLIARESGWNPGAFRYEPGVNDASYGLMQVLLGTAKSSLNNPNLTPSDLFIPDINIAAGAAYLRYQLSRYGDARRAVSAYNCGSECLTRPTSFWPNGNAPYADDVLMYQNWYLNHLTSSSGDQPVSTDESGAPVYDQGGDSLDWSLGEISAGTGLAILGVVGMILFMRSRRS